MAACVRCGGPQRQEMVDVSTLSDAEPVTIPGRWDTCSQCGSTARPVIVRPAPSMALIPYGPPVPSPEDLLRSIGIL